MNFFPLQPAVPSAFHFLVCLAVCLIMTAAPAAGSGHLSGGQVLAASPCDSVSSSPFADGMVIFTVSINGGGNTASVLANDSFTVSIDYYIQVCPTSTQNFCQVVAGFPNLSPQLCIYRGRVDCAGELGNLTFRLKAPAFPSEYLIAFDLKRTVTESGCPTVWPNGTPTPDRYLGCVTVTSGNGPFPVTGYADNITGTSATLHGEVNPSGFPTTARFVYGTTPGVYTDSVTTFESPVNGSTLAAVSASATGLTPNTRYYFRSTAENINGYNVGAVDSFFTGSRFALAEAVHSFGYLPLNGSKTDSITILNTGDITLLIASAVTLSGHFSVSPTSGSVSPGGSMKFAVTYEPPGYGRSLSGIVFLHGGAGSPDTQLVSGAVPIGGVLAGWNVISVPLNAPVPTRSALFPEAISNAFGFTTFYSTAETLLNGKGYWLKFPATDSLTVSGEQRATDTTTLSEGWNIIGVPSFPVPIDSVTTVPPGIITGNFFEYASGYSSVSLLRPGKGYWVKSAQAGTLRLNGQVGGVVSGAPAAAPEGCVPLVVTDAQGGTRRVYVIPPATSAGGMDIEAPPPPPAGIFDVRFSGGLLGARPGPGPGSRLALEFRGAEYPLTMSWESGVPGGELVVGGRRVSLAAPGDVIVDHGEGVWLTGAGSGGSTSGTASPGLLRNYPNPFNPSTVIAFSLPEGMEVGISVYNTLGELVFRLDGGFMGAGTHEVAFDAGGLPAGVYVARMTAGGHDSSMKMLLLK
jgi:hypothetical protein